MFSNDISEIKFTNQIKEAISFDLEELRDEYRRIYNQNHRY